MFSNHCLLVLSTFVLALLAQGSSAIDSTNQSPANKNEYRAPVIGALTQVLRDYKRFTSQPKFHLASSYVKWLEMAGAQVVPILLNQNDSYYEQMFNLTNGLVFPGGDNLLDPSKDTPMMHAAKKLYKLAVDANDRGDYYPIWGTCLGMELLTVLGSGKNKLVDCVTEDLALSTSFVERGRMFATANYMNITGTRDFSKEMMDALENENILYHFHHKCVTDSTLVKTNLTHFYRPLAYSNDANGLKFITIMEAHKYPFYAVQFHPEKPAFEYTITSHQKVIPHLKLAIAASRYFADFVVDIAKVNTHQAPKEVILDKFIYNYNAVYTAPMNDMYEQRYMFPYKDNGLSMEEFMSSSEDIEAQIK